jgi:hypothetical protein
MGLLQRLENEGTPTTLKNHHSFSDPFLFPSLLNFMYVFVCVCFAHLN